MRRERYALLLLLLILLATLTLGYEGSSSAGGGGKTRNALSGLFMEISKSFTKAGSRPTQMGSFNPNSFGGGNYRPGVPTSNFSFKPTDKKTRCPVAILPEDPMLVCVERPARSVPLLSWNLPEDFDMIVWYRGTYYLPYVESPSGPVPLKGVNCQPRYRLDTETPIVMTTYGVSKEFRVYTNFTGPLNYTSGLPLRVISRTENGSTAVYTFEVPPVGRNYTPGYYPVFIFTSNKTGRTALLMWVALLEKPVVEITDYPEALSGNGNLRMPIEGTVMYPNGSPVRDGLVTVTLNRTKNTTGTIVGVVRVSNGTFNLTAVVPEGEMPGSYHIVAHYRGYLAYPSNSDPLVTIKRVPEVELKRLNGTIVIFLNWNGNPLPNRTITVTVGNMSLNLTTDEKGYAYLRISSATGTVRIVYRGDDLYLPLNETLEIPPREKGKETTSSPEFKTKHLLDISRIIKLVSGLFLAVGIAYVVLKRKNLPELPLQSPKVFREPLKVLSPVRRVFLPNEPIRIVLNRPAEAFLDGELLGKGDAFELRPDVGTHVFSAEDVSFEFHVLPPREAVIKAYNLHFLPYVESLGVPTERRTPFEIVRALRSKGLDDPALEAIASLFVLADYAERPLESRDFIEFVEALEKLGVFGDGEE